MNVQEAITIINHQSHDQSKHGRGKGGGGSKGNRTHSVGLPQTKSRLTIDQAGEALRQMGFKLGRPETDLVAKVTTYEVTRPGGDKVKMTTSEISDLVYKGAG